jgi:hypothetical protein
VGILEFWRGGGAAAAAGAKGTRLAGADWLMSARDKNKIPKFPFLLESQTNQ